MSVTPEAAVIYSVTHFNANSRSLVDGVTAPVGACSSFSVARTFQTRASSRIVGRAETECWQQYILSTQSWVSLNPITDNVATVL
jgi:hypothetical protein